MDRKTSENTEEKTYGDNAAKRAAQLDAEMAYEALAVSSSMGVLGMEEAAAELIQLELTQEMLYKQNQENNSDK